MYLILMMARIHFFYVFNSDPWFLANSPKTFGTSCDKGDKDIFSYVNEVTFGMN